MAALHIHPLYREVLDQVRDRLKDRAVCIGNEYYWIQYKNGDFWLFDMSYYDMGDEERPVLDQKKILYVEYWDGARDCYIYLNTSISEQAANKVVSEILTDEDGRIVYQEVELSHDYPYDLNPYNYQTL